MAVRDWGHLYRAQCIRCFKDLETVGTEAEFMEDIRDEGWANFGAGWLCNECREDDVTEASGVRGEDDPGNPDA